MEPQAGGAPLCSVSSSLWGRRACPGNRDPDMWSGGGRPLSRGTEAEGRALLLGVWQGHCHALEVPMRDLVSLVSLTLLPRDLGVISLSH